MPKTKAYDWRRELKWLNPEFSSANTKLKTKYVLQAIARTHGIQAVVANVETHDSGAKKSRDLYGFIDILVNHDRAVQACGTDWQPHIEKFRHDCPKMQWWLSDERRSLELWGWREVANYRKDGSRAARDVWQPRIQLITWEFLQGKEPPTWVSFEALVKGASLHEAVTQVAA